MAYSNVPKTKCCVCFNNYDSAVHLPKVFPGCYHVSCNHCICLHSIELEAISCPFPGCLSNVQVEDQPVASIIADVTFQMRTEEALLLLALANRLQDNIVQCDLPISDEDGSMIKCSKQVAVLFQPRNLLLCKDCFANGDFSAKATLRWFLFQLNILLSFTD